MGDALKWFPLKFGHNDVHEHGPRCALTGLLCLWGGHGDRPDNFVLPLKTALFLLFSTILFQAPALKWEIWSISSSNLQYFEHCLSRR